MRDHLSFVLNGEVLRLRGFDPAMTLLTFLRRERRLTGTKEGCADGDCGACTVTVGIAFGGMAGTPKRAAHVEAALVGWPWSLTTAMEALPAFERDFAPITDMRGSAAYRIQMAKNLLVKSLHETEHTLRESRLVGRGAAFP